MKQVIRLLLLTSIFLLAAPRVLYAGVCDFDYLKAYPTFGAANLNRCFGGDNDSSEISKQLLKDIDALDKYDTDAALSEAAAKLINTIESALLAEQANAPDNMKQLFHKMRQRIAAAAADLRTRNERKAEYWRLDQDEYSFPELGIELDPMFSEACPVSSKDARSKTMDQCKSVYQAARGLVRYSNLTGATVLAVVKKTAILPEQEKVAALDKQWEEGRSQYIWELALNSYLFDRQIGKQCEKDYANSAISGESKADYCKRYQASRLPPPPKGQWILLHPNAAVEFADNGKTGGNEFNAVAVVDLIGYNRLDWGNNVLSNWALGASLIATISPESAGDTFGWGGMIHLNNKYSFGVARRDLGNGTETTWLFSVDLGRLILNEKSKDTTNAFRGLP